MSVDCLVGELLMAFSFFRGQLVLLLFPFPVKLFMLPTKRTFVFIIVEARYCEFVLYFYSQNIKPVNMIRISWLKQIFQFEKVRNYLGLCPLVVRYLELVQGTFLSFSIYCLELAFEHYRQVHSELQDESLQVSISKLPQGSLTCTRGDFPAQGTSN